MKLSDAEDELFARLNAPRDSAESHLRSLGTVDLPSIKEVLCLGIDTNILKALRREPTFADRMIVTLKKNSIALITPGQCIVEYWNNHQVFASDDWNVFKNDLSKLAKKLEANPDGGSGAAKMIDEISRLVQELSDDLDEAKSPQFLKKSQDLIRSLLEVATMPMASRTRFAGLATIRASSKIPPGFADDKLKAAPSGDFFAWVDFLLGALCVENDPGRRHAVWVTDDSKPDWKTGGKGHPSLVDEFYWVCQRDLSIISLQSLRALVKPSEVGPRVEDVDDASLNSPVTAS